MDKISQRTPDTLEGWLRHLETLHTTEIEMGLDRILQVYRRMKVNFHGAKIVTVGGTNGKGTTIATLQRLLLSQGKAVGAYTSPHIVRFNERVSINGIDVDDQQLVAAFAAVEAVRRSTSLTYFEFGTLVALQIFASMSLDYILLEVGLGGRLDAVNIVDPDVAIITSVDIDHVEWLGPDRESIGYEKAGILRAGGMAVYGELQPPSSVVQQVNAQKVDMRFFGKDFGYSHDNAVCYYTSGEGNHCHVDFVAGNIPISNQLCALQALQLLGENFSPKEIQEVFASVVVPGRMETLSRDPVVMVDVAHNPHAAGYLASRLAQIVPSRSKVVGVFSMLADKDIEGVVENMRSVVDHWVVFPLAVPRAALVENIARHLQQKEQTLDLAANADEALAIAKKNVQGDDLIVVFGSFYTVAAIKQSIGL